MDKIDEQLKLTGDEQENDEIDSQVELNFGLVINENARLARLLARCLVWFDEEVEDENDDLEEFFLEAAKLCRLKNGDDLAFKFIATDSALFATTPTERWARNFALRFFLIEGRSIRKNERIIL